jgi:hypothetical protein
MVFSEEWTAAVEQQSVTFYWNIWLRRITFCEDAHG